MPQDNVWQRIRDGFAMPDLAGPLVAADGIYVIALEAKLPSTIPPLDQIYGRVVVDYQSEQAYGLAQKAGTNFYYQLTVQMAAGKTFAQAAIAAGHAPLVLSPFSLSSQDIAEAGEHATVGQLKQAAFTTPVGKISNFTQDRDGGFVLYVQEMLPVNQTRKAAELPRFADQVRRSRQGEAFNLWLMAEANRELRDTPFAKQMTAAGAAQKP